MRLAAAYGGNRAFREFAIRESRGSQYVVCKSMQESRAVLFTYTWAILSAVVILLYDHDNAIIDIAIAIAVILNSCFTLNSGCEHNIHHMT